MKIYKKLYEFIQLRSQLNVRIGFVPTMGALHEGHLSLIERARKENDYVAVSIYVNPTQFNNQEDFQKYPSTLEDDLKLLEELKVNAVLLPDYESLYPDKFETYVDETVDSKILCGQYREGHFKGVLSVVIKLLNIVRPNACYMGEKDFQQLHLIQKMCHSLFIPTQIVACPTVREADGLAMSSRNKRLTATAREKAPMIYKLLNSELPNEEVINQLKTAGFDVEYVENHWGRRFAAASIDGVRLIDNV